MHVEIVTPAPPRSHNGNRVTALRWARLLRQLGHDVAVTTEWSGAAADVLVALHARRSAPAVRAFAGSHPQRPVIVALTGTDLYRDLAGSPQALAAMEAATGLVVLQPLARSSVPRHLRARVHVIHQSVAAPRAVGEPAADEHFDVAFLAHLRPVKDPLLVAEAVRLLPEGSPVRVTHLGAALDDDLGARADVETRTNPRYRWLGDRPRGEALALVARSHLLVLTSRLEGGANVISEALAAATPVVATRIDGSVGLLGAGYPGYFPVGDARGLAALLHRAATDAGYLADLTAHVRARRSLVDPARERRAWADLLAAVSQHRPDGAGTARGS